MSELNLDFLDETLDKYEAKGKKKAIKKIRIGYMLYAKFMSNKKFAENAMRFKNICLSNPAIIL